MQSSSQIITTNKATPNFIQVGCPFCHLTNSVKAQKGKYHIPWTCYLKLTGGLPSLTTKGSWLPSGRVAMPLINTPTFLYNIKKVYEPVVLFKRRMRHCVHLCSSGSAAAMISFVNFSLLLQKVGHQHRLLQLLTHDDATTSTDLSSGKTTTAYFFSKFTLQLEIHKTLWTGRKKKMSAHEQNV